MRATRSSLIDCIQLAPVELRLMLTLSLLILVMTLTAPLSTTVAWVYSAVFFFVTFAAPGALIWAQKFKKCGPFPRTICAIRSDVQRSEIRGTWDPAIPKLNATQERHRTHAK